ncbi:MAG: recombination protein NinB [Acetobacteraceae bacterium]
MIFRLAHSEARQRACDAIAQAPENYVVTIKPPTRSLDQNAALWALLTEFSERLEWPVNGAMVRMTPEEWKDVLTAAFRQETARLAMGLNGGVVMLGSRTSKMDKRTFSELLDFAQSVAAERIV